MARSRRRSPLAWLAAAALSAAPTAGTPALAAPEKGAVRVTRLEGPAIEGDLQRLGPEGLVLAGKAPLPLDRLREARFAPDAPPPPLERGVGLRVVLAGGEHVRGVLVSGTAQGLEVKPLDLGTMSLSFDLIQRVEVEAGTRDPCAQPTRARPPRAGSDVAYTKSGDAFSGTVASAAADAVVLEGARERTTKVAWSDLVVLHLDNPSLDPATGLVAEIETTGGSRLVASALAGDAQRLEATLRSGPKVSVPVSSVRAIRWTGGTFVYASDLPFRWDWTPYYSDEVATWERHFFGAFADRTAQGCPLRVGGAAYRHGIAVNSKSVVRIPLGKAYARFEAKLGIDDEALAAKSGPKGDVTARVLVDDREAWTSGGSVRGGEPPRTVGPIDVQGAETLVLEVDFGGGQMQMDRADWLDPILVRAK